ncbi:MAG: hypothetical protein ACLTZY_14185, partial [Alistipes indistinctus]
MVAQNVLHPVTLLYLSKLYILTSPIGKQSRWKNRYLPVLHDLKYRISHHLSFSINESCSFLQLCFDNAYNSVIYMGKQKYPCSLGAVQGTNQVTFNL